MFDQNLVMQIRISTIVEIIILASVRPILYLAALPLYFGSRTSGKSCKSGFVQVEVQFWDRKLGQKSWSKV